MFNYVNSLCVFPTHNTCHSSWLLRVAPHYLKKFAAILHYASSRKYYLPYVLIFSYQLAYYILNCGKSDNVSVIHRLSSRFIIHMQECFIHNTKNQSARVLLLLLLYRKLDVDVELVFRRVLHVLAGRVNILSCLYSQSFSSLVSGLSNNNFKYVPVPSNSK